MAIATKTGTIAAVTTKDSLVSDDRVTPNFVQPNPIPVPTNQYFLTDGDDYFVIPSKVGAFVFAGAGNDTVIGSNGNDYIIGGAGADILSGGNGIDTVSYETSRYGVNVNLTAAIQSGGDAQGDRLSGFENIVGSNYDDRLTGNSGDNIIVGGAGNDYINGGAGNDQLYGGDGDDYFRLSDGSDTITGGLGNDTFDFDGIGYTGTKQFLAVWGEGFHVYTSSQGYNSYTNIDTGIHQTFDGAGNVLQTTVLTGIENVNGSSLSDYIVGNANNNVLYSGSGGNDYVNGGGGNDTITGGSGYNVLLGDAGNDIVNGGSAGERIGGGAGDDVLYGNDGDDWIEGDGGLYDATSGGQTWNSSVTGNDLIYGGNGNDALYGGFGNDTVDGGTGNDFIADFGGNNLLTGGAGADQFYFTVVDFGGPLDPNLYFHSYVTDFQLGFDKINIDMPGWSGNNNLVNISFSGADTIVQYDANHQIIVVGAHLGATDIMYS